MGATPPTLQATANAAIAGGALAMIAAHLVLRFGFHAPPGVALTPLALTLLAGGGPLIVTLIQKARHREFGADLLAGIAIVTSAIAGEWLAGAIVVLMLSGGAALEAYAVRRASSALDALSRRMPHVAHRREAAGVVDVAVEALRTDDVIVLFPHEVCPADAVVLEGHGAMDESFVTGEPFGLPKAPGAAVISGAVNGETALTIRVVRPAAESRHAQILQVMRRAEEERPQMRRIGDRLGAWYTPLALAVAIAAWALSGEPRRFLAVLVIATPCPLLIAIPVAIIGAISVCARRSIVVRDPGALERANTCRVAIFDKTGTLTCGRPMLTEQAAAPGEDAADVLALVASVERYSRHPLAVAIVARAKAAGAPAYEASEVHEPPGAGLRGVVNGRAVEITSRRRLIERLPDAKASMPPEFDGLECAVLIDGRYSATYRFRDEPREESAAFLAHLRPFHRFERVMIVSGDRRSEVAYLARRLGVSEVFAEQTPEQKVAIVRAETARNPTLYVGDGINDAPALVSATVGVAIAGGGGDVASEAADAVILGNSLAKADEFLHVGQRMRAIALQSAVGGIALSLAGMAAAAAGWLTPVAGALAQDAIDVFAVLNVLRVALPPRSPSDIETPSAADSATPRIRRRLLEPLLVPKARSRDEQPDEPPKSSSEGADLPRLEPELGTGGDHKFTGPPA